MFISLSPCTGWCNLNPLQRLQHLLQPTLSSNCPQDPFPGQALIFPVNLAREIYGTLLQFSTATAGYVGDFRKPDDLLLNRPNLRNILSLGLSVHYDL